jgi:hypothetical protein
MKGNIVTLFFPGDGMRPRSNVALYKGIKDFKDNNNGTITFKTQKYGTITTPLPWRLAEDVDLEAVVEHGQEDVPVAGNQARLRARGW